MSVTTLCMFFFGCTVLVGQLLRKCMAMRSPEAQAALAAEEEQRRAQFSELVRKGRAIISRLSGR